MRKDKIGDEYISLKQLAREIGIDRSNLRKYILNQNIKPHKRRTPDSRNQLALAVTNTEAALVRQMRQDHGFLDNSKPVDNEAGVFYILQLIPELDPNRIKLGFTDNIEARLLQHRTAAPTAILISTWPCRRTWERTIIDHLSIRYCKFIMNEVFECNNIDVLRSAANKIFTLLPAPDAKCPLSKHSPYHNK